MLTSNWNVFDTPGTLPRTSPSAFFDKPQLGTIRTVTGGTATFILPGYDGGRFLFGPAPFTGHIPQQTLTVSGGGATVTVPEVKPTSGQKCVVVFMNGEETSPVIVGWF